MRKLICLGFTLLCLTPVIGQAQVDDVLRTLSTIVVVDGKIQETGVLADPSSTVFIELTKDSLVGSDLDQREFQGEILAPQLTSALSKSPRPRMREIVSFELFTDRADTAVFVDRYAMMHERTRLREQILYGESFARTSGAQVLTRFTRDQNIGQAALWQYDNLESEWKRIGGITSNSSEPDVDVFSAIIFETGNYTIWDEDPAPEFSPTTDPSLVNLVEQSSFPSVEPINNEVFDVVGIEGEETPFEVTDDELFNQPVPATLPLSDDTEEPVGLIPAVGLPAPEVEAITEDDTPTNEFSDQFLDTIEDTRPSAPNLSAEASAEAKTVEAPPGAVLPQSGGEDTSINWINYLAFLLIIVAIGGSVWMVRQKPY